MAPLTSCHSRTPLQASSLPLNWCWLTASPPRESLGEEGPTGQTWVLSYSRGGRKLRQGTWGAWLTSPIHEGTAQGSQPRLQTPWTLSKPLTAGVGRPPTSFSCTLHVPPSQVTLSQAVLTTHSTCT